MRVKHDRDALLSTLNSLRERNELLESRSSAWKSTWRGRARDSTSETGATTIKILAVGPSPTSNTRGRTTSTAASCGKHRGPPTRKNTKQRRKRRARRDGRVPQGGPGQRRVPPRQAGRVDEHGGRVRRDRGFAAVTHGPELAAREANLWPRKIVREALTGSVQRGRRTHGRALALDCLIRLAGYEANKRQFWAHRPLRRLLYATAFERLAPGPARKSGQGAPLDSVT